MSYYHRDDSLKLHYINHKVYGEGFVFKIGERVFGPFEDRIVAVVEMRRRLALEDRTFELVEEV